MLEITLNVGGENVKYTQEKITLGAMRRLAEMDKNMKELSESGISEEEQGLEMLDEMAMSIVALFKNQFTFDDLIYGLEFESMEEFNEIVEGIFEQVSLGTEGKKKAPTTAKRTTKAPAK